MSGTKKGLGAMRNIRIYRLFLGGATGAPLFVPMFGASRPRELRGDKWRSLNLTGKESARGFRDVIKIRARGQAIYVRAKVTIH